MDALKNNCVVRLAGAIDASQTTIALMSGDGAKLPTPPFNLSLWDRETHPDVTNIANYEIIRVTARNVDNITVTRAQESTTASNKAVGSIAYLGVTAKTISDLDVSIAEAKTTPVDADQLGIIDSAASNVLKKLTWANIKATLKTYFDNIYEASIGNKGTAFNKNFGTTEGTVCEGNDSRLSNARTPTTHEHAISEVTDLQTTLNGKMANTSIASQSNLTIDGATNNYFIVSLSANASFSLSNIATGRMYYFLIKNTSSSDITITLPNTADIKASLTFVVKASNKYKEVALFFDGTNRIWQISEDLT